MIMFKLKRLRPDFSKLLYKRKDRGDIQDEQRSALCAGKRISKKGNIYYEYRENRSDSPKKGLFR